MKWIFGKRGLALREVFSKLDVLKIVAYSVFSLCLVGCFSSLEAGETSARQSFTFRAEWFTGGDMTLRGLPYSDRYVALSPGPNSSDSRATYELEFPETGDYELWGFYSACDSRPLTVELDGKVVSEQALAATNGSWLTSASTWNREVLLTNVTAGVHELTIHAFSPDIPHFSAFKLVPTFDLKKSWNAPRAIVKQKLQETWQPSPWSGGWYEPYARDRYQKRESGETFSDHFARETAIALAPKDSVHFVVSTSPISDDDREIDLFDELTYTPGMFAAESAEQGSGTLLYVRARIDGSTDETSARLPNSESFILTAERFESLLNRSKESIERFRQDIGDDSYLAKSYERIETIRENGRRCFAGLNSETSAEDAEECCRVYFEAVRLYARIGWANPILDFDQLLFVLRNARDLGLPQNYQSNCVLNPNGFDDSLNTLSFPFVFDKSDPDEVDDIISQDKDVAPSSHSLFKPDYPTFLGDLDLHFDADKALVSSLTRERRWNVFELDLNAAREGKTTYEIMKPKLPEMPDADNYDACYMPDDSVIFMSTACYIAVPCVSGTTRVTNTFKLNAEDNSIRRLTFDQEHNWCPTLMPDGRVLYLRWEYTDIPHVPSRLLFQMNPDGTNQRAHYGSNSLWPVSMMYARPIPDSTSKFCCIVTGHHGVSRMGELVLFDVQKGRKENQGAVERICGYPKQVESRTDPKYHSTLWGDNIVDESWPKFLHPFPLSEDYYLVAAQPDRNALWGIYLVDRFDNMYLLMENENFACFEPSPWRETDRPPVIQDRVDLTSQEATVYCSDVYYGDGLKNVPRGTVKYLRLYSYNYLYPMVGGASSIIGVDGPWDVRQVLGVVPVNEDGSALFKVPANVPIAIQPLDENGQALQQMRSWFTAMPGETLSCVGCHEDENTTNAVSSLAFKSDKVAEIIPWNGPMRGFSYEREVQPVLDHYCVACHDGQDHNWGVVAFDLRGGNIVQDFVSALQMGEPRDKCGKFSTSYLNLQAYVRAPGLESDYFLLNPMEFSANTTELYQILANGHYGLQMDADAWDRIITWIDMNTPYHGTWTEFAGDNNVNYWNKRRKELLELYANFEDVSEEVRGTMYDPKLSGALTELAWMRVPVNTRLSDWERQIFQEVSEGKRSFPSGEELRDRLERELLPLDVKAIKNKPQEPGWENPNRTDWNRVAQKTEVWNMSEPYLVPNERKDVVASPDNAKVAVETDGDTMTVRLTPTVSLKLQKIQPLNSESKSLWVGTYEVTNAQFEIFDPTHDSGVESRQGLSHGFRGFFVNEPELPVCRVSWNEATAFCDWLSEKTGKVFRLPSGEEWKHACLAGANTPFSFGDWDASYTRYANLADQTLIEFICDNYIRQRNPNPAVTYYDDWVPKDRRYCDNGFLSEKPGHYLPNAWGLYDMHGNVSEWTSSCQSPSYGVDLMDQQAPLYEARGGSWRDRPYRATASFVKEYYPWQRVFDVGFRVVCESSQE